MLNKQSVTTFEKWRFENLEKILEKLFKILNNSSLDTSQIFKRIPIHIQVISNQHSSTREVSTKSIERVITLHRACFINSIKLIFLRFVINSTLTQNEVFFQHFHEI